VLKQYIQKHYSHARVRPCTRAVVSGGKKNFELVGKNKNNGIRANGI
jgi:hypothetical protein